MTASLRGNLEDFSFTDVLQLVSQQGKTGRLEVTAETRNYAVFFEEGSVIYASPREGHEHAALAKLLLRCGALTQEQLREAEVRHKLELKPLPQVLQDTGVVPARDMKALVTLLIEETFFELLQESRGSFGFESRDVSLLSGWSQPLPCEHVLMEGLRKLDEWATFSADAGSVREVQKHTGADFTEYRRKFKKSQASELKAAERLYNLIDGRVTVRRAIDLARLSTFEGMRLLAGLRRAGLVERAPRARLRLGALGERARESLRTRRVSTFAATVLCALCLTVVTAVAGVRLLSLQGADEVRAYQELQVDFAWWRLRNAIEAHRFASGRWPANLVELVTKGFVPADALATPSGESYYYVRRGADILLRAPEVEKNSDP